MSVLFVGLSVFVCFFFFNDTATTEIYTLSLHDALPIFVPREQHPCPWFRCARHRRHEDRKSTRLNSSHQIISYAVFCLKKKQQSYQIQSGDHMECGLLLENRKAAGR